RCDISFTSDGSSCPTASASATGMASALRDQHVGELPAHERRALLVLGDELGDHVLPPAALVLVDHGAARAHAHAGPHRLEEVELHLGVEPRVHDVLAVTQVERL